MKHLSWTSEPAITCFSCWPSTETEGTEIKEKYLIVVLLQTFWIKLELWTDYYAVKVLNQILSKTLFCTLLKETKVKFLDWVTQYCSKIRSLASLKECKLMYTAYNYAQMHIPIFCNSLEFLFSKIPSL